MVKESKSTVSLLKVAFSFFFFLIDIRLFVEFGVEFITCGIINGCFGTVPLYTSEDNVNLQLYTDFPDQIITAQSGNGEASETDVTSHGTRQELNFDDGTLKGKDSYNC